MAVKSVHPALQAMLRTLKRHPYSDTLKRHPYSDTLTRLASNDPAKLVSAKYQKRSSPSTCDSDSGEAGGVCGRRRGASHFGVRAASGIPRDAAFISFATHSAPRNGVKIQNFHVIR